MTAADRGYTDAEAKFRLFQEGRNTSLSPEDTSHSPSPMNHNTAPFWGIGEHLSQNSLNHVLRLSLEKYPLGNDDKQWLPFDKLMQLVDESHVRRELCQVINQDQAENYAKKICESVTYVDNHGDQLTTSFRSVFAILTMMGKAEDAPWFLDAGLSHKHLPLQMVEADPPNLRLCNPLFPGTIWDAPGDWHDADLHLFCLYQNYMLSPFFKLTSEEVFLYDLDPNAVLPFIEVGERQRQGYQGSVWQVKIHEAHHDAIELSVWTFLCYN
jgi:hypothetical protein